MRSAGTVGGAQSSAVSCPTNGETALARSLLSVAVTLVASVTTPGFPQSRPASGVPAAEVFVIGTVHAPRGLLLDSSYSAAHLRGALERFQPSLIGVEASPLAHSWGLTRYATWEIDHVVAPWASAHGVPVFGVDWEDLEAAASFTRRWLASLRASDTQPPRSLAEAHAEAVRVAAQIERLLRGDAADPDNRHRHEWFAWINSGARNDAPVVRQFWDAAAREGAEGRTARELGARDDRIVHQVVTLVRRYPGARLALLIGFSHKPDLDRKLGREPGIRLVQLGDLPAIGRRELDLLWAPEDAVGTLAESLNGNGYYFDPAAVDSARTHRALDALRRHRIRTPEVRYLEARLLMVEGRLEEAEASLRRIATDSSVTEPFPLGPYQPLLPVQMLARLELGKVHDLRGERTAALEEYAHVRRALELLRPPMPADSDFPTLTDWATMARASASRIAAYQAIREIVDMLLGEPWSITAR